MVRKILLTIGFALLLLSLLAYLIAAGLFLSPLRDYALTRVVTYVSKSLNGTLEIGALRGSLLSSPVLQHVVLRDAQGAIVGQIDEVRLSYDLAALLKKRLTIREIAIVRPQLAVVQEADGRLNIGHLLSPSRPVRPAEPKEPSSGFGLPMAVALERLQVQDGQFDLRLPSLPGVQHIEGLQVGLTARADQEGIRAELQQLTARATPADVNLQTKGSFQLRAGVMQIDGLRLQLGHTLLTIAGVLPGSQQSANLELQLQPLDVTEIGRLLQDHALHGQLRFILKAEGPPEALVIHGQLNPIGKGEQASIDLRGEVNTVATPPRYRSTLDIDKLDLAAWVERAALQSDINLHVRVEGEGLSPQELRSQVQMEIRPSHLGNIALRPSHLHIEAQQGRFHVQRFNIDTSVARMTATGALDFAGRSDLRYQVAADLAGLQQLLEMQALDGTIQLQGQATGEWPALNARGTLEARNVRFQDNRVRSLQATFEASELGAQPHMAAEVLVRQVQAGTLPVEQVRLEATYLGAERLLRFATAVAQSPGYSARVNGVLTLLEAGQDVVLDELVVQFPDRTWQAMAPLHVTREQQRIQIQQVHLAHADESIEASGSVDGDRLQNLRLRVSQIDLSYWRRLLKLPNMVAGRATLQFALAGTLAEPLVQGEISLEPESQQGLPFEQLHMTLTYEQRRLQSAMRLQQANREVLALDLRLPVDLAFAALPLGQRLQDGPVELHLDFKQPQLADLRRLQPTLPKLAGTLQGKLSLQGNYAALALAADMQGEGLGVEGTAEQVTADVQLLGRVVAAASVEELARGLSQGQLTPKIEELVLRVPILSGKVPAQGAAPRPFEVRDLLLQADGQLSAHGPQGTLQTLRLQAKAFGFPQTNLELAARWTPQAVELTRLQVRTPQSAIQGRGQLALPGQQLQLRIEIPQLRLDEFHVALPPTLPPAVQGAIDVTGSLQAPQVAARLQYAGSQILADLTAQLQERLPRYQATLCVDGFDMAKVLPEAQGRLQARVSLQGTGFAGAQRRATLNLAVDGADFTLAPGLAVGLQASVAGDAIRLDSFRVRSKPVELAAQGTISAARQVALTYTLTIGDLASLQKPLGVELQANGGLSGEVRGRVDALQARGALRLDKWRYAQFQGQRLQIDFSAAQLPAAPQATVRGQILGVQGPSLETSSVRLEADLKSPQGTFTVAVTEGPYQKTMLAGDVNLTDGQRLALRRLRLQHQDLAWENDGPIEVVRSAQGTLQVQRLLLRSGSQQISVQGRLAPTGLVNIEVHIAQVQIQPAVRALVPNATPPAGLINLDLTLGGTLQQPQMQGELRMTSLAWQNRALGEVRATIALQGKTLRTDLRWRDQTREIMQVSGTLGLSPESALALNVLATDVDLATLASGISGISESAGLFRLDLQLTGTLRQPQARGSLEVHHGALRLAATGERYQDIEARMVFAGNRVDIERLYVGSRGGPLQLMGRVETANMTLQRIDLSIQAQDFAAMRTPAYEAVVSTDLTVRGSLQEMSATGSVTVPRARMVVNEIPGAGPKVVQPWELTVKGVYGPGPAAVAARDGASPASLGPEVPLPFLRADLRVNMPRNVWVQGPGTAMEMSGDLRVTKALREPFVLSGSVQMVRGFAGFYGKKFVLQEGQVTFTGSQEINPLLDVTVTQKVSTYVVTVHVEGKAKQPKITFSSTPELPQADIISLLVIGKTTDRLTSGEQNALSNQLQQAAGSLVAGQLEKLVGKSLGLDTIEVTAGDKLGSGNVSIGRYVTQDVFLSFERQFGQPEGGSKQAGGNKVSVEYSLNPRLKLKGSSSDSGASTVEFLWNLDY